VRLDKRMKYARRVNIFSADGTRCLYRVHSELAKRMVDAGLVTVKAGTRRVYEAFIASLPGPIISRTIPSIRALQQRQPVYRERVLSSDEGEWCCGPLLWQFRKIFAEDKDLFMTVLREVSAPERGIDV